MIGFFNLQKTSNLLVLMDAQIKLKGKVQYLEVVVQDYNHYWRIISKNSGKSVVKKIQ